MLICLLCAFGIVSVYLLYTKPYIEVDYCKSIGKEIGKLRLKQFHLSAIRYGDTQEEIIFSFDLKNMSKFDQDQAECADECVNDISLVRKAATKWLNENISSELNSKNVHFNFWTLPGDSITMSNYNIRERLVHPAQFQFFLNLDVNASAAMDFIDAKTIEIRIDENDHIEFLKDFKNLEILHLKGRDLTNDEKEYLKSILPDCVIISNRVTISDVKLSDPVY